MSGFRVVLLLAAVAGAESGVGGIRNPVAAQEMPRGVTTDLFDEALRNNLDAPPETRVTSRTPIRFGPVILLVGTCGGLLLLVRKRRWLTARGAPIDDLPSSETGAGPEPLSERVPHSKSSSPKPVKTAIDLPPHVVDFLRRRAEREARAGAQLASSDHTSPDEARSRVDVWIADHVAGSGDE